MTSGWISPGRKCPGPRIRSRERARDRIPAPNPSCERNDDLETSGARITARAGDVLHGRSELLDAQERRRAAVDAEPGRVVDDPERRGRLLVEALPGSGPRRPRRIGVPEQPHAADRRCARARGPRGVEQVHRQPLSPAAGPVGSRELGPGEQPGHDQPRHGQPALRRELGDRRLGKDPPRDRVRPRGLSRHGGLLRRRARDGHRRRGIELREHPHRGRAPARGSEERRHAEGEPARRLDPVQVRRDERARRAPGGRPARADPGADSGAAEHAAPGQERPRTAARP